MKTTIYLLLTALLVVSYNPSKAQTTKSEKLEFQIHSDWVTKHDENNSEAEYYELTTPDFLVENDVAIIQLYHHSTENNELNSTISLIDKEGVVLVALSELTEFHEMAVQYTAFPVGDIDGNGLKDIKMEFPYMGNGLMVCVI